MVTIKKLRSGSIVYLTTMKTAERINNFCGKHKLTVGQFEELRDLIDEIIKDEVEDYKRGLE